MACDFHVYLNAGQHAGAVEAATEALDLVQRLEDQLTIYRPQSEVSVINRDAADRACVVESATVRTAVPLRGLEQSDGWCVRYHGRSTGQGLGIPHADAAVFRRPNR